MKADSCQQLRDKPSKRVARLGNSGFRIPNAGSDATAETRLTTDSSKFLVQDSKTRFVSWCVSGGDKTSSRISNFELHLLSIANR